MVIDVWKWKCPICGKNIEEDFDTHYVKTECVGCTHDCPECGSLVLINNGGICTDFGSVLQRMSDQIDEMEKNGEIVLDEESDEYIEVKKDDDAKE
jgi:endogenous inhibitor of DNA gyrase (YacG/DUF329 family)